jgi:VanZ family protein
MPKFSSTYNGSDKLYHGIAYSTLAICWLFSFYKRPKAKYIIVILCILYGILLEVLQGTLTNYRTADYFDMLANLLGVLVGLTIFNLVLKKNSFN